MRSARPLSFLQHAGTYPVAARFMHWLMAAGILWMLCSAIAHATARNSVLDAWMWPTHKPVGALLMVLILVRVLLAWAQRRQRPAPVNTAARLAHLTLYVLMAAIPALGLLRQFGSGRAFTPFGLPLFGGFEGPRIDWMVQLGNNWHGELGWALLVLVSLHIIMVIVHIARGERHIWLRMRG